MFNAEWQQSSQHHPQANNLIVTAARFSFERFTSNLHIYVGVPSFLFSSGSEISTDMMSMRENTYDRVFYKNEN